PLCSLLLPYTTLFRSRPQSDGDAALAPLLRGPDADDGDDEADEDEAVDASADAHAHLGGVGDVFEDHAEDEQRPGDGLGDGEELEEAFGSHERPLCPDKVNGP